MNRYDGFDMCVAAFLGGVASFLIIILVVSFTGNFASNADQRWETELIERGYAEYQTDENRKTEFVWYDDE